MVRALGRRFYPWRHADDVPSADLYRTSVGFPVTPRLAYAGDRTGGSFDFNHWDLVQARQLADIRPDYHIVKNYNLLGRFDTLLLKDADVFAVYMPWYDAFPDLKHKGIAQASRDQTNYTNRRESSSSCATTCVNTTRSSISATISRPGNRQAAGDLERG